MEDVSAVMGEIESRFGKSTVVLWGRSMGATTALLYSMKYNRKNKVIALVLDSPFHNLNKVTIKML